MAFGLTAAAGLVSAVEPVVVVPAVGGFVVGGVVAGFGVGVVVGGFVVAGVVAGVVVPDVVVAGSVVSIFTGVTAVVGSGNGVLSTFATNSSIPVVLLS